MKTRLLAGCLIILFVAFPALAAAESYVVGIEPDYPPWAFVSQGQYKGIAPEAVRAMAKQQGFDVKFKSLPFASLIPALKAHKIDILATALTVSSKRAKQIGFTLPWWLVNMDVLVKRDSDKNIVTGLCCGAHVGTQAGTTEYHWLQQLKKNNVDVNVRTYSEATTGINDLKVGRIDTYIMDAGPGRQFIKKYSKSIRLAGQVDPHPPQVYALGVRKGDKKLLKILNKAEVDLYKSGKWAGIIHKYRPGVSVHEIPVALPGNIPSYKKPIPGFAQ